MALLKIRPSTRIVGLMRNMWYGDLHHVQIQRVMPLFVSLAICLPSHSLELSKRDDRPASELECAQNGELEARALTLQSAENRCLSHSLELQASYLQERAAQYRYLQGISAFLPSLNYQEGFGIQKDQRGFARKVSLNQILYNNSALVTKALKKVDWTLAKLQTISLENELLFSVRSKYFACVLAQVNRQVTKDQIALLRNSLKQEQKRLEVGACTNFDVNQAKVALASALSDYFESARKEKIAIDQLASVLGTRAGSEQLPEVSDREIDIERIPFLKSKLALLDSGLDSLFDRNSTASEQFEWGVAHRQSPLDLEQIRQFKRQALLYKPDLRIARLRLASGLLNVKLQRSTYFPQVSVSVTSDNTARPSRSVLGGGQKLSGAVTLNWALFDGLARERGVQDAHLQWLAAKSLYCKRQSDVEFQVHRQFQALEESLLANWVASGGVDLAKQGLQLAQIRYDAGAITSLDFRRAANDLVKARLAREQLRFNAANAYYQITATCATECQRRLDDLEDLQLDVD